MLHLWITVVLLEISPRANTLYVAGEDWRLAYDMTDYIKSCLRRTLWH